MAVVDEKKAKEELRKKKFYSLYYCYGEDPFKLSQFQQHLQAALLGDDSNAFNVSIFHGDELDASELLNESESLSLWQTQKRLMIIRGAERIPAKQQELYEYGEPRTKDAGDHDKNAHTDSPGAV